MARDLYHEIARTIRDYRTINSALSRMNGGKDPEVSCGCLIAILAISVIFALWLSHSVSRPAQTPTPTATTAVTVSAPLGSAPRSAPTAVPFTPTPTIDPKLKIMYQDDEGNCLVKGNINSKGDKIYHLPGSPSYNSTKIDEEAGERWFCTELGAIEAGWHAPGK